MPEIDPFKTPQFRAYEKKVKKELIPMIEDSAVCLSLVPPDEDGEVAVDVKFAVELGFMIMLDKPIIAIVSPGRRVPNKLAIVADEIVEGDVGDPDFEERFKAAINRVRAGLEKS